MNNEYEKYCESYGSFMQSEYWSRVKSGWKSEYITVRDNNGEIEGEVLVLVKQIPLVHTAMLYAPRGFVCDFHNKAVLEKLFDKVKSVAKRYHAYTIKLDPLIDESDHIAIENLKSLGFEYHPEKVGYDNIQCRENYMLDIEDKSAEEIFSAFKSKWRYNIRLSQRKGVSCDFYGEEKLDDFVRLMEKTAHRDGFQMRSKEYFRNFLDSFDGKAKLCMCYAGDKALSGALCVEYGSVMSYVYGCSSDDQRQLMPNYLMQWSMIKYAIENNMKIYDFCGIPYWYDESHKNFGVYRFKQGFNGYVKTYAGEFDYTFRGVMSRLADFVQKIR